MLTKKQFKAALKQVAADTEPMMVCGVVDGAEGLVVGDIARQHYQQNGAGYSVLYVVSDDRRLERVSETLQFYAPDIKVITLPAWDCVPYDRVSPNSDISAARIAAMAGIIVSRKKKQPVLVLTTVNAMLQRLPTRLFIQKSAMNLKAGAQVKMEDVVLKLEAAGYMRTSTVMEVGEYAVRGGIIDLFPASRELPVRLDFFGDELESIRIFEPESQRTQGTKLKSFLLLPSGEAPFGAKVISAFRSRYLEEFGAVTADDQLYEAITAGHRYEGMEHWLPLFHDSLETIFDYLPKAMVVFDAQSEEARRGRLEQIDDHYLARQQDLERKAFGAAVYKAVPKKKLFLNEHEFQQVLKGRQLRHLTPFDMPEVEGGIKTLNLEIRQGRSFSPERINDVSTLYKVVVEHIAWLQKHKKKVMIACSSIGSRERINHLLKEQGLRISSNTEDWNQVEMLEGSLVGAGVLPLESGLVGGHFAVISEQDILGDRLVRKKRRTKSDANVITEATGIAVGDLVVHVDYGIGRFEGLKTIEVGGGAHDCLELTYQGQKLNTLAQLFLPVENIELLSRFGSDDAGAVLDRLGGEAWQARKSKLKKKILEIANELIKLAAARLLKPAPVLEIDAGEYETFVTSFPYEPTEDQNNAIDAVLDDLSRGSPMDRLVVGDVGFGKTEVAMRAAFVAAMAGKQVVLIVPTTLLARQHFQNFHERFEGYPLRVRQLSRMVTAKEMAKTREGLKRGDVDIVIGTHALLAKTMKFSDLGLVIVDEEQHFGVKHKEQLKSLKENVHVLTLTATPIPRTLQMSLTGVRDLSIIATPPVDRLAVRSFVTPFDPLVLREALMRERFRGGQSFYVCPRVRDLSTAEEFLKEHVPELKVAKAHGQMAAGQLDDIMTAFYERKYDVLLSTTIIESGIDVPTANTMIIHKAHMFGLAQLYQLRGRVGRSKTRAYAYFTNPASHKLTINASKRLKVLQSLDTLGAGFQLASHDLDIRGAGNLLGDQQSGHIKEVGFELYQSMLEEAVAKLKGGDASKGLEDTWAPQINIGTSVLIPESYVEDLTIRLGLYRRLSSLKLASDIDEFAAELIDRFGKMPVEVKHLLEIVQIKSLCRICNIKQVDAGPKGVVALFRKGIFPKPEALIDLIDSSMLPLKAHPDGIVCKGEWETADERLKGSWELVNVLADLVQTGKAEEAAS